MELIDYTISYRCFWIILCIVYLLMIAFYAWDWYWNTENLQEAGFAFLVPVCFPIVGFFIVLFRNYYIDKQKDKLYEELYAEKTFFLDELKILRPIDQKKEMNQVPMEEALTFNSYEIRRKMIMDTLQEEKMMDYLLVLKKALENGDAETSHYASSIIMQLQGKIQHALLEEQKAFELHPEEQEVLIQYEKDLYQLLSGKLLEKENLRKYFVQYEKVSDQLLKAVQVKEEHYFHRIHICFQMGDFSRSSILVERYLTDYPESEDGILCKIEHCIYTKDRKALIEFFHELPNRPVILTQKTLKYIRFLRESEKV